MKKEELMIGDWFWWEAEGKKYPMQVTEKTFALLDEDVWNFEPIPLTKEILEKNGFEDFYEGGCIIKELSDDEMPTLYVWDGNDSLYVVDNYSTNKYTYIKKCKYVHEFQHELKSCGIKKEIKL